MYTSYDSRSDGCDNRNDGCDGPYNVLTVVITIRGLKKLVCSGNVRYNVRMCNLYTQSAEWQCCAAAMDWRCRPMISLGITQRAAMMVWYTVGSVGWVIIVGGCQFVGGGMGPAQTVGQDSLHMSIECWPRQQICSVPTIVGI